MSRWGQQLRGEVPELKPVVNTVLNLLLTSQKRAPQIAFRCRCGFARSKGGFGSVLHLCVALGEQPSSRCPCSCGDSPAKMWVRLGGASRSSWPSSR